MNIQEFKDYIQSLCLSHNDVKAFVWGDAFGHLQELQTGVESPLVLIDSPDIRYSHQGYTGRSIGYTTELVVLSLTQLDDVAERDGELQKMLDLILELIREFERRWQYNELEKVNLTSTITQTRLDNHIGWRVTVEFWFDINIPVNPAKWQ